MYNLHAIVHRIFLAVTYSKSQPDFHIR